MHTLEEHIVCTAISEKLSEEEVIDICYEHNVNYNTVLELASDIYEILENGLNEDDQVMLTYAIKNGLLDESTSLFLLEHVVDSNLIESVDSDVLLEGKVLDAIKKHSRKIALATALGATVGGGNAAIDASRDAYKPYIEAKAKAEQKQKDYEYAKEIHNNTVKQHETTIASNSPENQAYRNLQKLESNQEKSKENLNQFNKHKTETLANIENNIARDEFKHRFQDTPTNINVKIPKKVKQSKSRDFGIETRNTGTNVVNTIKSGAKAVGDFFSGVSGSEGEVENGTPKYQMLTTKQHNEKVDRAQNRYKVAKNNFDETNGETEKELEAKFKQAKNDHDRYMNNPENVEKLKRLMHAHEQIANTQGNMEYQKGELDKARQDQESKLPHIGHRIVHVIDQYTKKPLGDLIDKTKEQIKASLNSIGR